MPRQPERCVRVFTRAGPEKWEASRLTDVRHALRGETSLPFAFVLDMGRKTGRPRAWGPSSSAQPGDGKFVLVMRRPLRRGEADVYLGCIERAEEGEGLDPDVYRASKKTQSALTVKHQLQRALNTVFGRKAERRFTMFIVVGGVYRFNPQSDDFLVIVDEDCQPASVVQVRPTSETVVQPGICQRV